MAFFHFCYFFSLFFQCCLTWLLAYPALAILSLVLPIHSRFKVSTMEQFQCNPKNGSLASIFSNFEIPSQPNNLVILNKASAIRELGRGKLTLQYVVPKYLLQHKQF